MMKEKMKKYCFAVGRLDALTDEFMNAVHAVYMGIGACLGYNREEEAMKKMYGCMREIEFHEKHPHLFELKDETKESFFREAEEIQELIAEYRPETEKERDLFWLWGGHTPDSDCETEQILIMCDGAQYEIGRLEY